MAGVSGGGTVCAAYTGAQTNTQLVASPGAGRVLVIQWAAISSGATAGEVKLLDGSAGTVLFDAFVAINSSLAINCKRAPMVLTAATGLYVTTVTATPTRYTVGYTIEAA